MGYCMTQDNSEFFIPADKINEAFESVKELKGGYNDHGNSTTLKEIIMEKWLFDIDADSSGNINDINFCGEKLHEHYELFKALAPFVKEGSSIEMTGEDGNKWRWVFKNGKCYEINAEIVWPEIPKE